MSATTPVRQYCSNTAQGLYQVPLVPVREHSGNRVWTVRAGRTGSGLALFQVYAPDMDEARDSAETMARAMGSRTLTGGRFTVHAGQELMPLKDSPVADTVQAPDFWEWDPAEGPEVRLDTVDGLLDATYVTDDEAGNILVLVSGELQEHPAEALHPRCECGNPFTLCHPEA